MKNSLYNNSIEIGIRCLLILNYSRNNEQVDIERLMYLDYLCLNTNDIGGDSSIHAPVPNRGVQVYVRKELITKGLKILASKELLDVILTKDGIFYSKNSNTAMFLSYFESQYYKKLEERVKWTTEKFHESDNESLNMFVGANLYKWGSDILEDSKHI